MYVMYTLCVYIYIIHISMAYGPPTLERMGFRNDAPQNPYASGNDHPSLWKINNGLKLSHILINGLSAESAILIDNQIE